MNILFLHMFNLGTGWGGSASVLLGLYNEMRELGHRVEVVSAGKPDPFGITVCELPFAKELTFGPEKRDGEITLDEIDTSELVEMAAAAARRIETEVFERGVPDLLIANHINLMALACWQLNRKFGIPYRIISYGTDTKLLLQNERYGEIFAVAAREAERIFALSRYIANEAAAGTGARSIEVVGGVVDSRLFYPVDTCVESDGGLVFVGRLVTEKGLWVLLDAMTRQKTVRRLELVGEGPLREEVYRFITRNSLGNRVAMLGYVPRPGLRAILAQSSALVVPSIWQEPLGLVIFEAFACGLPVIATSVGGIPEYVQDGKNGLLVPEGDAPALSHAIDRLCGDKFFYEQIRSNVRTMKIPTYRDLALQLIQ